ncbi:MAG: hypothetical protein WBP64_06300 [Nitrososphaeraceae archaeon]
MLQNLTSGIIIGCDLKVKQVIDHLRREGEYSSKPIIKKWIVSITTLDEGSRLLLNSIDTSGSVKLFMHVI